jgi:hypothetical protein
MRTSGISITVSFVPPTERKHKATLFYTVAKEPEQDLILVYV